MTPPIQKDKKAEIPTAADTRAERRKKKKGLIVAIDPGIAACGVAVFKTGYLHGCGLATKRVGAGMNQKMAIAEETAILVEKLAYDLRDHWIDGELFIDHLIIEKMETREGMECAHADLINLSIVMGIMAHRLKWNWFTELLPSWTNGRNKAQTEQKVRKALDNYETKKLESGLYGVKPENIKEITDAAGMGLTIVDRIRK